MGAIRVNNRQAKGMWVDGYAINNMYVTPITYDNNGNEIKGLKKQVVRTFDIDGDDTFVFDDVSKTSVLIGQQPAGINNNFGHSYLTATPYLDVQRDGDYWVYKSKSNYNCRSYKGSIQYSISGYDGNEFKAFSIYINKNIGIELDISVYNYKFTIWINGASAESISISKTSGYVFIDYNIYFNRATKEYMINLTVDGTTKNAKVNMREQFGILTVKLENPNGGGKGYNFTNEVAKFTDGIDGCDTAPVFFSADGWALKSRFYNELRGSTKEQQALHKKSYNDFMQRKRNANR